jgi:broad specificity phosphatase PhoE
MSPDHPTPLDVDAWSKFFPDVKFRKGETGIIPNRRGETMKEIHERARRALKVLLRRADEDGLDTILLCTHAATNIALGRALTGDPEVCTNITVLTIRWTCELARRRWGSISVNLKMEHNGNVLETETHHTYQEEKNAIGGSMATSQEMIQK